MVILSCLAIVRLNSDTDNGDLTHITVAEVAHSVFYAPQYVAHGLGYFEDEGLDVEIILTSRQNLLCGQNYLLRCAI